MRIEKPDPKSITRVNGREVDALTVIGPATASNGLEWFLVRIVINGRCVMNDGREFWVVMCGPQTTDWGWNIGEDNEMVSYGFASAIAKLVGQSMAPTYVKEVEE